MSLSSLAVQLDRRAVERYLRSSETQDFIARLGIVVRDRARVNAQQITSKTDALISKPGMDGEGVFVDVGYNKDHPGFFLWWHEVGTVRHAPTPHLRPALTQASVSEATGAADGPSLTYTTKAGVTRQATQAQINNWTRGSR